jgi:hypothetical protein
VTGHIGLTYWSIRGEAMTVRFAEKGRESEAVLGSSVVKELLRQLGGRGGRRHDGDENGVQSSCSLEDAERGR